MGIRFNVIEHMHPVPFARSTALQLAVVTLLPIAPRLLTMFSLEEILERLLKVVF